MVGIKDSDPMVDRFKIYVPLIPVDRFKIYVPLIPASP